MYYPFFEMSPDLGDDDVEDVLCFRPRVIEASDGTRWTINVMRAIWQKFDLLTDPKWNSALTESYFLDAALAAEFEKPFDLDYRFSTVVAESHERVRLVVTSADSATSGRNSGCTDG